MQNPPNYSAPGEGAGKSSTGLDANIAALLSYVLGFVTGLVFFLIEKESRYVRFHAAQSMLLGGGVIVVFVALMIVNVALALFSTTLATLFGLLWFVVWLAAIGLIILCCVKAYQGQRFKLPVIGDMAERFASK